MNGDRIRTDHVRGIWNLANGVDPVLISSRGMGERQLLDCDNSDSGTNRRVEIRNVTQDY